MDKEVATSVGGTLGGAALGGIFGLIQGAVNNKYAKEADERQYQYTTLLNEQANAQYRQNMVDSYALQKEGMIKAGINPAAMYANGSSGAGGASVVPNTPIGGHQAQTNFAMTPMDISATKLNLANAKKAEAEANSISGVQTEEANARITKILADTKLTEAQKTYAEICNYIADATKDTNIQMTSEQYSNLFYQNNLLCEQIESAMTQNRISKETAQQVIENVKLQNEKIINENKLILVQKGIAEEQLDQAIQMTLESAEKGNIEFYKVKKQEEWLIKELEQNLHLSERGQNIDAIAKAVQAICTALGLGINGAKIFGTSAKVVKGFR